MEDIKFGYMCKTEFDREIGETTGVYRIYSTAEELKEKCKCVKNCGIVKVYINLVQVIEPENRKWNKE